MGPAKELLRSFFGRGKGHKAERQSVAQSGNEGSGKLPALELIPGELKINIFFHQVECGEGQIHCWSFVTEGMGAHRQKEMILTLRREAEQALEEYPRRIVEVFGNIFARAAQGQIVDEGQSTLFREAGLSGYPQVRGFGYVKPKGFRGVETRGAPLLACVLLLGDEGPIAYEFGLTRITTMLGRQYGHYPCPTWCELKREPVASLSEARGSLLGGIARVHVRGSFYEERKHIVLSVHPSSRAGLKEILEATAIATPIALRTQPDPFADACLVWNPGSEQSMAITPQGSSGSKKTGAFLAFLPEQSEIEVRSVEDGYAVLLTNDAWNQVRRALLEEADLVLPGAVSPGVGITLKWIKPVTYVSAVTGEKITAEGWVTYEPQVQFDPAREPRVAISSAHTVLLSDNQTLEENTTAEDLASCGNAVDQAVDDFFAGLQARTDRELTVHVELAVTGSRIRFAGTPALESEIAKKLQEKLERLRLPRVSGLVKFEVILRIWG